MARIRTIKPDFFKNEDLAELDPFCRLLFIGLWTLADRDGRLEDRPKRIKVQVLPYDNVDVDQLLWALHESEFITRYEVNGVEIIQITTFEKHQRITGSEADTKSEFPGVSKETLRKQPGNTSETPRTTGREGKGRERKGMEGKEAAFAELFPEKKSFKLWSEDEFFNELVTFQSNFEKLLLREFFDYWREKTPSGKMKFQLEKTWETNLRLERWKRNKEKFSKNGQSTSVKITGSGELSKIIAAQSDH